MDIVSVNVGQPRMVEWRGGTVATGIFKEPVSGPVGVGRLNLAGDRQADLTVHGGVDKAVYAYPSEHYPRWAAELDRELAWGMFGENLTTRGWLEDAVHVGDRFRVGSSEMTVTQPRQPCYKLGIRFGDPAMVKRFMKAGRPGWYFAVAAEGHVTQGDPIERIHEDERGLTVAQVNGLFGRDPDPGLLGRAAEHDGLPDQLRRYFRQRLG